MRFSRKIPPGPSDPPPPRRLIDVATNDEGRLRDDRSGISSLFDQYRPMVYGLALSYTRSPQDAEDVCQEVFLTLLEKPPAPGKERPWLARVAVNRCRDLLTSPWRRRRENDDTALERLTFETPEEAGLFAAWGRCPPTAGPCSTCAITRGSRWPSWPASSAPPPRRSLPALPGQTTTQEEAGGTRL